MKKLYLLDVSGYLFRAYFALPPMSNAKGQPTHALYGFVRSILKLLKEVEPTHIAAIFDGPDNKKSRTAVYEQYKIHRKPIPADLPQQIDWASDFCDHMGIPKVTAEGVEADDSIGSISQFMASEGAHVYICSSDKDFCQLVSDKISMVHTLKDNVVIDPAKVEELYGIRPDQIVDYLAIMGDSADNIPGLPGFGPKTAMALLQEFGTLEEILANPDKVPGKKKQETIKEQKELALVSQKLARIDTDVDCPQDEEFYRKQEPNLESLAGFFKEMGFTSLLKEVAAKAEPKQEEIPTSYTVIDDEEKFASLLSKLQKCKEICFDTETTDVRPMRAALVGIGFGIEPGTAWYVPLNGNLGKEQVLKAVKPLFEDPNIGFYGHNVKYDVHVLANWDIHVATICFDTIIASYMLNSHSRRHSLDVLTLDLFDKVKIATKELLGTGKKAITMADVPIDDVGNYCCEDVDYTVRLKEIFAPQLKERKLDKLFYELELPLVPILFAMERNGIFADQEVLQGLSVTFKNELESLQKEIYAAAGEEFKVNSPKQLSLILFDKLGIQPLKKTQTGYSTDAEVLNELRHVHPIVDLVLRYRTVEKLRSTYVDTLPNEINPNTGRIHCTFTQYVAATGRLACQDPNLQNIPIRSEEGRMIRSAFRPQEPESYFLSADYSQIELRLLAHLSEDPELIKAFEHGEDVHAYTASLIFEIPLNEVTKDQRRHAKAVNFGIIYGQQAFGLAKEVGVSVRDAAQFIETYFRRYPKVRDYVEGQKEKARQTGRAVTMMGRERLIPEISSKNGIQRAAAERLAVNAPLQGSAADLIKLAMLAVDAQLTKHQYDTLMLLQIHDELLLEVPKNELEAVKRMVKEEMEGAAEFKVPLVVDLTVGNNWKEC